MVQILQSPSYKAGMLCLPTKWPLFKFPFENEVLGQNGKILNNFSVTTDTVFVIKRLL